MKELLLKIAGVKTEEAFYKKFPTKEAFFKAHPEAKEILANYKENMESDEEEEDIEEEVEEDLKESFKEKRKMVLEMFNRISKF